MNDGDDELADTLRQRVDRALAERLAQPDALSPGALIRILYPVIGKYRDAGLALADIASVLQAEGYPINKGHLVRHLGVIEKTSDRSPGQQDSASATPKTHSDSRKTKPVGKASTSGRSTVDTTGAAPSKARQALPEQSAPNRGQNATDYTPGDPLALEGKWITGEPVRWWTPSPAGDAAPTESPLPMPLRYPLPEALRPKDMPPVPDEWAIYDLKAMPDDRLALPDTGSMFRKWWCYFSPRISSGSRLYGVLPGCDPEAPYGRYPDGRPYENEHGVWGIGQGGATRQRSLIDKVPPGEPTPIDLFLGFPSAEGPNAGYYLLSNPDDPLILAWKEAARRCGRPTDPPKVT